jgi:hypothetical protein
MNVPICLNLYPKALAYPFFFNAQSFKMCPSYSFFYIFFATTISGSFPKPWEELRGASM